MTDDAGSELISALKLFAFNAHLAEVELDQIERQEQLDLGRRKASETEDAETYYPQFDQDLRAEAAEMAFHYQRFYCLERSIRRLITATLQASDGANWWSGTRVPPALQTEVAKRMQKEVDSAVTVRSSEPLDFTTFGELGEVIKSNWDLFGAIFNSQRAVEKVMANLNTLRGPIAHCSLLAADEVLRLDLSMKDWFRLME